VPVGFELSDLKRRQNCREACSIAVVAVTKKRLIMMSVLAQVVDGNCLKH